MGISQEAERLAASGTRQDLARIATLLGASTSPDLSRRLAKLLFDSGQPGVDVLCQALDDPAVQPFAERVLRHSSDMAVWEALCNASMARANETREKASLVMRLAAGSADKRCYAIPRDPSRQLGLYRDDARGFSLLFPPDWVSLFPRRVRGLLHGTWSIRFRSSPQAVKWGPRESFSSQHAEVQVSAAVDVGPEPCRATRGGAGEPGEAARTTGQGARIGGGA